MKTRRGSAFVAVLAVLALLSILMEIALSLLTSHLSESRRRGDASYAGELARSGLEWARACIAAGGSCSGRREVAGGVIEIDARPDGEFYDVTATGRVLHGRAEGPARVATTRVRKPDAQGGGGGGILPPEAAPPSPAPGSGSAAPAGPAPRPTPPERSSEEFPRYF